MKGEELIVTLMATADKDKLRYLVGNNLSIIQFARNHPQFSTIMSWASILSPLIDFDNLNAEQVMEFLRKNRPDIVEIVTPDWIKNQIEAVKAWKNGQR